VIAFVGDLSIHSSPDYNYIKKRGGTGNYLLSAGLKALRFVLDYCVNNEIRTVVFTGDIFEYKDRLPVAIKNKFISLMDHYKHNMKKYIIVGNHDRNKEGELGIKWLQQYATIVDCPLIEDMHGVLIGMVPYHSDSNVIKRWIKEVRRAGILCGHFPLKGIRLSSGFELEKGITKSDIGHFLYAILGHVHEPMNIEWQGRRKIFYVGSIYQTDWSEAGGMKRFMVLDSDVNLHSVEIPPFMDRVIIPIYDSEDIKRLKSGSKHTVEETTFLRLDISQGVLHDIDAIKKALPKCRRVFYNYVNIETQGFNGRDIEVKNAAQHFQAFVNDNLRSIKGKDRKIYKKVIEEVLRDGE